MIIKAGGFYHINMLLISTYTDFSRDIKSIMLNDAPWQGGRISQVQMPAHEFPKRGFRTALAVIPQ